MGPLCPPLSFPLILSDLKVFRGKGVCSVHGGAAVGQPAWVQGASGSSGSGGNTKPTPVT